jgi:hypothetical protein
MNPITLAALPALQDRLYDEILSGIVHGMPLPSADVYDRPWHRDAAMMLLALETRSEAHRIREWILGLTDPFDRNNAGIEEPDNLGQTLYLLSVVADADHPLVPKILESAARVAKTGPDGTHLTGRTDFAPHPVYQTKWMKFGLAALGLPDAWSVPNVIDSYGSLFWMSRTPHVEGPRFDPMDGNYPYLQWAEAHFYREAPRWDLLSDGPSLTWESEASHANYPDPAHRRCEPHTWHAAEAYLYFHHLGLEFDQPEFDQR